MYLSRRAIIAGLLATTATAALAEAPSTSLRPKPRDSKAQSVKRRHAQTPLARLIQEAGLSGKQSIVVSDVTSGKILEFHGTNTKLPPASVTKSVTALYALHNLGPDFRFSTRLIGTGPISEGVLQGDLVLEGGGDPNLDSDGLAELAEQLKAKGVRKITGKFKVYSGALPYQRMIDPSQPDYVGYNPSISGLNLNFNRVYFEWKRTGDSYSVAMDARAKRYRPSVRGIRMSIVNREGPLFTYKNGGKTENWTVMRKALGQGGGRWLPVRDTAGYAGEVFRSIAAQHAISLPAPVKQKSISKGAVLAQENSGRMWAMMRAMLKYSTNLTAEISGLTATRKRGSQARTLSASGREMTSWAQKTYGIRGAKFVDHSGLGGASRVSAGQMTKMLVKSGWNGALRPVLKDIPLVNSKGKKAPIDGVSVVAKTGTLNFASALSGYIDCPNGSKLAFAIFTADMEKRGKINKAQRERPEGGKSWARRSRRMQQKLLRRWALEYGVG